MNAKTDIKELMATGHQTYLRNISIDCTIFGFHEKELRILLLKPNFTEKWSLPGGFIKLSEGIDHAAKRILKERTGLENIFLQQFHAFGDALRAPLRPNERFMENVGISIEKSWLFERFVSIGYYALVDFSKIEAEQDYARDSCTWFTVNKLPELMLDHNDIFNEALNYLRLQLNQHQIGSSLLPTKFTMPELQKLYEIILGQKLDRRNFQRKIMCANIIKKLDERKAGVAHRAPFLYKFDKRKFQIGL